MTKPKLIYRGEKPNIAEVGTLFESELERKLKSVKFGKYSQIYSFATENLAGYMGDLDFEGKRVLTVGGSGDQIINAYACGASQVVGFDINMLAGFMTELKLNALENLNFGKFKKFFLRETETGIELNPNVFDKSVFNQIRDDLSSEARQFFERGYGWFVEGTMLRESILFNNAYDTNQKKQLANKYISSDEEFKIAKKACRGKETEWHCSSLQEIVSGLKPNSFDIIMLSNIADYAHKIYPDCEDYLQKFTDELINPLSNSICPGGIICAAYIYDVDNSEYRTAVDQPDIRKKIFETTGLQYSELKFDSVIAGQRDAVVLLKNK